MNNLFLNYSLPDLHIKLSQKKLSFSDLADETIKAVEMHEKNTLAWVRYDLAHLKSSALQMVYTEKLKLIQGIPFGIKDIFNTKYYPTEMGSPIWKGFTPGNNARIVDSLLNAGGLIVGKTVTAEFAVHSLNETLNPHDPTRTPGTSSSGSAAAVATGMVPFALATQTAGSIVRPASFCGVWGMKPSFGMIPRTGVLKTTDSLDTIGFIAAHAKSLRVILDQVRVRGPNYPFVYKKVDSRGAFPKKQSEQWRIGFIKTHTWSGAETYVKHSVEKLAKQIDSTPGFTLEEIELPTLFSEAHEIHSVIYTKSLAYYFQNEKQISSHITPIMSEMIQEGESISSSRFKLALDQQVHLTHLLEKIIADYDLVLTMGTSSSAPLRNIEELPDPSLIWTLCHVPTVAAPAFRCLNNLPFGVQFIARKWNDYLLLQGIETLVEKGLLPEGSQAIIPRRDTFLDTNNDKTTTTNAH
ncbi:MAG: amidase [Gammaproteobacteria bacterium]|nr:amidase [Gammaproteobacteria bacterium]